ncbi:MAG: glutamyl-tRNA amidotransferase [Gammaproteobacteria bacterium RIFCSPLOWO2_02_FULL_47_50]|jgi:hypothetical protein|nr:MAG: glutamyl-tRNA amidotransferase [Gammaproteobacteria bacterium RIFCSPLOWO2_01_FULL_47_190]OGT74226.1 MAG: glutamyl-tRNA amidotransferase [Gammaproteobacteria bacterium RIFCSPLOWO2_12_47_11]OGT80532.1 MAG: glutamyl-tRNA amidotransferase [Gammaproteobacteria bacterium RIFCSPLOWO2_02_FULL_47_50]
MAEIKQRLNDDVKTAMRNRDRERLGTLRMILAAIKQKEVDERIELDDTQILGVLDKMTKQHRESIAQFELAGRRDLVEKENKELAIVQSYLPAQLSDEEIQALLKQAIQETGAVSMQDMGKVMAVLKPKLQGRADIGKISGLVKAKLS